jgi:hypothetical protein
MTDDGVRDTGRRPVIAARWAAFGRPGRDKPGPYNSIAIALAERCLMIGKRSSARLGAGGSA